MKEKALPILKTASYLVQIILASAAFPFTLGGFNPNLSNGVIIVIICLIGSVALLGGQLCTPTHADGMMAILALFEFGVIAFIGFSGPQALLAAIVLIIHATAASLVVVYQFNIDQ